MGRFTRVFLFMAAFGGVLSAAAPVSARSPFDGSWNISIVTQRGECDATYQLTLRVLNGQVYSDAYQTNGRVGKDGAVRVTISAGGANAHGVGRLSRTVGSGSWRVPARKCVGYWRARRG